MKNPSEITFKQTKEVTVKFNPSYGDFTQVYHAGLQDYVGNLRHSESYRILFWLFPDISMDGIRTLVDSISKRTISTSKSDYNRYYEYMMNKWGNAKKYRMYTEYIKELSDSKLIISPQGNGEYIMNPFIFWQGDIDKRYQLCKQLDLRGNWDIYLPISPKEISEQNKIMAGIEKGIIFICKCGYEGNTKTSIVRTRSHRTVLGVFCKVCGNQQEQFDTSMIKKNVILEK
jgi:hypothetical protein